MNDQTALLSLFDDSQPTAPYRKDSATSLQAAVKVTPTLNLLRFKVLSAIASWGPMTADECAARIDYHWMRVRPRFSELSLPKYGMLYLEPTGEQRPSELGNPMDVLRLTDAGKNALQRAGDVFHAANSGDKAVEKSLPKAS